MHENHFMNHLGFVVGKIEPGFIEGELRIEQHHKQQIGFLHGGVVATLADLAAGFASFTLVKKNQTVVTAEMKVSYLNPGLGPVAFCKGFVLKAGQKLIFAEAEIFTENNGILTLIAKGSATYAVIDTPV
ncbi:MAG: thioesterase [Bacteroidetes bacterium B1(2017)]|nr:MAG: thioesterase [Bacteroidetes bacterium B1(2017)]